MVNLVLNTLRWSYSRLKKRDMFKQSISLTHNGEERVSSIIGTLSTILILIIAAVYGVYFTSKMLTRSEVAWNKNTKRVDWSQTNETLVLTEDDPKIQYIWDATGTTGTTLNFINHAHAHHRHLDYVGDTEEAITTNIPLVD